MLRHRWAWLLAAALASVAADDGDRLLPRCLLDTGDLDFARSDGDASAHLVREGRYLQLQEEALTAREFSLEFRNNAALSYLLQGDTTAADVSFATLARFCDARWDWRRSDGGHGPAETAPVGLLAPCLAVYKNWHWALSARPAGGDGPLMDPARELARGPRVP